MMQQRRGSATCGPHAICPNDWSGPFYVNVNPLTVYLPCPWDLCSLTVMHFLRKIGMCWLVWVLGPPDSCLTKIKKVRSLISPSCTPARRALGVLPSFMLVVVTAYHHFLLHYYPPGYTPKSTQLLCSFTSLSVWGFDLRALLNLGAALTMVRDPRLTFHRNGEK